MCVCVRMCVCLLKLSNTNISATSGPITTKIYLKHHWRGGKASLGFRPDHYLCTRLLGLIGLLLRPDCGHKVRKFNSLFELHIYIHYHTYIHTYKH